MPRLYYASLKGSAKSLATRQGTKAGDLSAHVRTWSVGVLTEAKTNANAEAEIHIVVTPGSGTTNGGNGDTRQRRYIGTVRHTPDGDIFIPSESLCAAFGYRGKNPPLISIPVL